MKNADDKRRRFREVLAGDACLRPASVSDPLSMRAAEDIGYEIAMLAGSVASLTVLGAPDIALLSVTELAEQVRRLCRAGGLPLLVDGDHGYGNALNVRRAIEEIEAAGAAAITIEDTVLPASFGAAAASLISARELAGKLRAALDARTDASFTIVGRTNANLVADKEDLLSRQSALQDSGVDAVFVTGVKTLQDLDVLVVGARVPLLLGSAPADATIAELSARGVRLCLAGHRAYLDGVAATYHRLQQQRLGTEAGVSEPKALVEQLSRAERYDRWTKKFLA